SLRPASCGLGWAPLPRRRDDMRLAQAAPLILCTLVLLTGCAPAPEKPAEPPVPGAAPAAAAVDAMVRSADGVAIHYHAEGNGEPAVVLIHCWSCNGTFWKPVVEHLAPTRRVVTVDLGGHGPSGRNRAAWTIPAYSSYGRAAV